MNFFDKFFTPTILYEGELDTGTEGGEGAGGSQKTLEQITNEKLAGKEPTPKGGGGEDEGGETPPPDRKDESPKGDEQPAPPEDEGADGGDEQPPGGGEQAPVDGGDGDEPTEDFYDPEVHVEGTPSHSNKFPTREKAEFAAIHKAERLKNKLSELDESGIGRGAIKLPDATGDQADAVDQFTSLERVHAMDDDDLRGFLNDADAAYQGLERRESRVKDEQQARQVQNKYEQAQVDLYDGLKNLVSEDEIKQNISKLGDVESGKQYVKSLIDKKVEQELSDDRAELEDWIEKVEEGEIEYDSMKKFAAERDRRLDTIRQKEQDIRDQFKPTMQTLDQVYELAETAQQTTEPTPEQKAARMWDSFDEMQKDIVSQFDSSLPDQYAILADNADARAELTAAKNWAIQNRSDYNDLQNPADWRKAILQGWPKHKENIRAGRQKEQLEGDKDEKKPGGSGKSSGKDDIPSPGNQDLLEGISDRNVHARNRTALDKLEELTNAAAG